MPQERGAPAETGAGELTSVPGPGSGERPRTLPVETGPTPAAVETSPGPGRHAVPAGTGATGTARDVAAPADITRDGTARDSTARDGAAPADITRDGTARDDPVAWLIALAMFAVYTTISVFRYLRLDPGSWDLGIYTQYVQQLAHLHAPVVAIRGAGFDLLGDHFQPIVGLVAPFFRLFPTPVTLLVAQALLTAVSVVPVCRAARALLGTGVSRVIGTAYGFSWGLQQMIIFDFHEIAFAVPLLACSLSALVRRRLRAAVLWALPLVLVKEDQGLTVAAIGLVMVAAAVRARTGRGRNGLAGPRSALRDRLALRAGTGPEAGAWAWAGGLLVAWGLAWSMLAIAVIIPHFNPAHHYPYWPDGGVISPGGGHFSAGGLLAQLTRAGPEKLRTTAVVLLPVAFLALRSPLAVVAVLGMALRFLSTNSNFWGTQWHYSATLMPIVFLAAIDGLARIQARAARGEIRAFRDQVRPARSLAGAAHSQAEAAHSQAGAAHSQAGAAGAAGLPSATASHRAPRPGRSAAWYAAVVMAAVAAALAFRFPVADLWNPQTYQISPHARAERAAIARVPAGTTVESTLTLLAPLATRDTTFWIGTAGNPVPHYIVFDTASSGYARPPSNVLRFVDQWYPGVTYQTIFEADDVYVFRRSAKTRGPR